LLIVNIIYLNFLESDFIRKVIIMDKKLKFLINYIKY